MPQRKPRELGRRPTALGPSNRVKRRGQKPWWEKQTTEGGGEGGNRGRFRWRGGGRCGGVFSIPKKVLHGRKANIGEKERHVVAKNLGKTFKINYTQGGRETSGIGGRI